MTHPQEPAYPGAAVRPPSGGTAITTAVLALVCLPWTWWGIYKNMDFLLQGAKYPYSLALHVTACVLELVTLVAGAVLLFLRSPVGRWLVSAGGALIVLQGVISVVVFSLLLGGFGEDGITYLVVGPLMVLPAVAMLMLVVLPATGQWCVRRR
ncbi:hypothetical protein ACFWY9_35650 [Amycolatopsis sp. NPDC059027]|uniref:hypothetical protein n=1 Tax=unclassified Amycolatopsis TaxID=2618356 RepID=UPI00366D9E77